MNKSIFSLKSLGVYLFVFGLGMSPVAPTFAASTDPACTLYYINNDVIANTLSSVSIQVAKNDFVGLIWNGTNASEAVDRDNKTIQSLGAQIVIPLRDEVYSYTFSQGTKSVTCSIKLEVISGTLSTKATAKSGEKLTLSGKTADVKKVVVVVYPAGSTTTIYTTKSLDVKNGKFSIKMPKTLADGAYKIVLKTADIVPVVLASSNVMVGKAQPIVQTNLIIKTVPLLAGGVAKLGAGVAVAYLQVINVGIAPANVTGFTFAQTGSAQPFAIVGFSMTDETGLARGAVGNMISGTPLINNTVTIPLLTTLAPKESRLFTARAVVAPTGAAYVGSTMSFALIAVSGDIKVQSVLPLSSVIWTVGQ